MKVDGHLCGFGEGADGASQIAKVGMAIPGRDAFEDGTQLRIVADGLCQQLDLPAQGDDLRLLCIGFCGEGGECLLPRVGESHPGAHAEGVVENNQKKAALGVCGGAVHKGICEGQHYKQNKRSAKREEQKVFETAMPGGTLRAAFKEHQRADWARCSDVTPQQMHEDGDAERR